MMVRIQYMQPYFYTGLKIKKQYTGKHYSKNLFNHRRDRDQDRGGDRDRKSRFEDKNRSNRSGGGSKYFDKEEQDNNEGRGFSGEDKEL